MDSHYTALFVSALLCLGVGVQWASWKLRQPPILLLLVAGFIAGALLPEAYQVKALIPEGLLFALVSLSVAVILFEGGLSLQFRELQESVGVVIRLVTVGVAVTWLLAGLAAWQLFGLHPALAALVGAILTVSGPTVVMPLLRHVRPKQRVASVAKWEGIVNDPVAAALSVATFEAVLAGGGPNSAGAAAVGMLGIGAVGALLGGASAWAILALFRRHAVPDYLENPLLLAAITAAFTVSNLFAAESGLVAVTVFGVLLANQQTIDVQHVVAFKETLRVLLISALFIVLASLTPVGSLLALGWQGLAFIGVLLVVVRPIAVWCSTIGSRLKTNERLFLCWLAPRGIVGAAVASLFALELAGEESLAPQLASQAELLAPIVFSVIVGAVVVYSTTLAPLANWLQIADPDPQGLLFVGADPAVRPVAAAVQSAGFRVVLVDTNHRHVSQARMMGLSAVQANVLSEYAVDAIDLGGLGQLLAMTSSHEVNSLAVLHFAHVFGRDKVYQLSTGAAAKKPRNATASSLTAQRLFSADLTHGELSRKIAGGAVVKKTNLTDEFTYEDFVARYGVRAVVLFVVDAGKLRVRTASAKPSYKPGQTLIILADETPATAEEKPALTQDA